jgi:hypothetical protein
MNINITVEKKIARVAGTPVIICGNSGYNITFTLDDEWDNLPVKTARFSWYKNGEKLFTDIEFRGHTVEAPIMVDITEVYVGIFAGALSTTTPAKIVCERSILCGEGTRMMKGETGDAASVVIGEVKTVEADVPAKVENVGTAQAAVLNFDIPKGETGAKIEIGEVTQSEPGTQPQVTNTGTAAKAVLNFVIPKAERDYITTITGAALRFFLGTQEQYDALNDADKQSLFAIITDDKTLEQVQAQLDSLEEKVGDADTVNGVEITGEKSDIQFYNYPVTLTLKDNYAGSGEDGYSFYGFTAAEDDRQSVTSSMTLYYKGEAAKVTSYLAAGTGVLRVEENGALDTAIKNGLTESNAVTMTLYTHKTGLSTVYMGTKAVSSSPVVVLSSDCRGKAFDIKYAAPSDTAGRTVTYSSRVYMPATKPTSDYFANIFPHFLSHATLPTEGCDFTVGFGLNASGQLIAATAGGHSVNILRIAEINE